MSDEWRDMSHDERIETLLGDIASTLVRIAIALEAR